MDEDLHNNDVDMNPDEEETDLPTEGGSTSEDNSTQNQLQEWVISTGNDSGTPGETPSTPTSPSGPEEIIQVNIPVKRRWVISNYDQTYLRQLYENGGVFYVVYEDGTEDECEYTDVINPFLISQARIVAEVDEITQANNQHFWYDNNGAHVTDETRDSWEENASYNFSDLSDNNNHNNLLMNSYGLIIRRALKNLAAFSRSAVTFYDGDGNEASNVLATFGKNGAQIGSADTSRISMNSTSISGYAKEGYKYFDFSGNGVLFYDSEDNTNSVAAFSKNGARIGAQNTTRILINPTYITGRSKYDETYFSISMDEYGDATVLAQSYSTIRFYTYKQTVNLSDETMYWSEYPTGSRIESWPPQQDDTYVVCYIFDYTTPQIFFTVYYGVPTNGWVTVDLGQYKYDGYNSIEVIANETMTSVKFYIQRPKSYPKFIFGSGTADNKYALSEGDATTASGESSHAEGYNTTASGDYSHAEGSYTTASGDRSHAEGMSTTASGRRSHAEGISTTASGDYSHAEGDDTTASGYNSHAEGYETIASAAYSHAQNYYTIAASNYQTAIGKYNISDASSVYAFIIGNGTAENARSNALTVDWSGNLSISGSIFSGWGTSYNKGIFVCRNSAAILSKTINTQTDYGGIYICNGTVDDFIARNYVREYASGTRVWFTEVSRTVNGTRKWNAFGVGLDSSNNCTYHIYDITAFRRAIADEGVVNATLNSTYTTGGQIRCVRKGNVVFYNINGLAFKAYSGRQQVATIPTGYRPAEIIYANFNLTAGTQNTPLYIIIEPGGAVKVDGGVARSVWGSACGIRA